MSLITHVEALIAELHEDATFPESLIARLEEEVLPVIYNVHVVCTENSPGPIFYSLWESDGGGDWSGEAFGQLTPGDGRWFELKPLSQLFPGQVRPAGESQLVVATTEQWGGAYVFHTSKLALHYDQHKEPPGPFGYPATNKIYSGYLEPAGPDGKSSETLFLINLEVGKNEPYNYLQFWYDEPGPRSPIV